MHQCQITGFTSLVTHVSNDSKLAVQSWLSQAIPPGGRTCGSVNPNETINYALHGTGGSGPCQTALGPQPVHSCASPSWSTVIDKAKLVYAVGWYNAQHNVVNISAGDHVIGSSPSFCQAVNLSQQQVRAASQVVLYLVQGCQPVSPTDPKHSVAATGNGTTVPQTLMGVVAGCGEVDG